MDRITLGHGSGGKLMYSLIEELISPILEIKSRDDSAVWEIKSGRIAITTDSYVVAPLFFPGGNIGELAINGTINDLAVCGAIPECITCGLIIEEGFPTEDLRKILQSMKRAADSAGVRVVAGDTKVVQRGKADGIFINTSGIGTIPEGVDLSGRNARAGDRVLISGPIGNHGIAVISEREGFHFDPPLLSDTRALNSLCQSILSLGEKVHVMRDPTRGGLATTLKEIALDSGVSILVYEDHIPIEEPVRGACDILGFDPLYVANEGIVVSVVSEDVAEDALRIMKKHPHAPEPALIGEVRSDNPGNVYLRTSIGGLRPVEMLPGEQLPRIC